MKMSAEYRAAMDAPIREAPAHIKVYIGIIDGTAANDTTLSDNGMLRLSDPVKAEAGISYATFEPGRFRLDGSRRLTGASRLGAAGYWSESYSDANGVFTVPPQLTLSFGVPHTLGGLTLAFDAVSDPPDEIEIAMYCGGIEKECCAVQPDADPYQWLHRMEDIDCIVLRWTTTRQPHNRARLSHVEFGVGVTYSDKEIVKATEKHTDAPVSLSLPSASLTIQLRDARAAAMADFYMSGQRVIVDHCVMLSSGDATVPSGVWYMDSYDVDGNTVTVNAVDRIALLNATTYEHSTYNVKWRSLYSLAQAVFADSGLAADEYRISDALRDVQSMAPLPIVTHAAALQLIANYGRCRLYCARDGRVTLEPIGGHAADGNVKCTADTILGDPKITRLTKLRSVLTTWMYRTRYPGLMIELYSGKIAPNQGVVRVEHEMALNPTVQVSDTSATVQAEHYAYVSYLTITSPQSADMDIKILGEKLYEMQHPTSSAANATGNDLSVSNPLCDAEKWSSYIDTVRDYYAMRTSTEAEILGRPELDCGERVMTESGLALVTATELTYNGAWREKVTYRR